MKNLTAKQRAFVLAYAETRNASKAAIKAGYSKKAAYQQGSENLRKPEIVAAYDAYVRPRLEQHGITADKVLQELADIGFAPWRDYIQIGPHETRLHLAEKIQALRTLSEILGLFRNDHTVHDAPSLALHYHPGMSAEESRQQLLLYLRQ